MFTVEPVEQKDVAPLKPMEMHSCFHLFSVFFDDILDLICLRGQTFFLALVVTCWSRRDLLNLLVLLPFDTQTLEARHPGV